MLASAEIIDRLWLRMAEIYGHRWTSAHGSDAAKGSGETWAKGLAGLDRSDVARGVEACISGALSWPPTLPEFRELCLGIPTAANVRVTFSQLRGDAPVDPFARLVWSYIDGFAFRNASREQADRMVSDAYASAREFRMKGGALPQVLAEIEAPKAEKPNVPASPEARAAVLAAAKAQLAGAL